MQKSVARARHDFRDAPDLVIVFVHEAGEDAEERCLHAVAIVNVQVVPTAFRCEFLDVHANRCCVWSSLDQPRALHVHRVIANAIENAAGVSGQSAKISIKIIVHT